MTEEDEFQNAVVADWWHYDATNKMLYCEIKENDQPVSKHFEARVIPSGIENAWLGVSTTTNDHILLWDDKELSAGKNLVAEVTNWTIALRGNYKDGASFEDDLRLIVPLDNGSAIAIGKSRNRQYYLLPIAEKEKKGV